MRTLFGHQETYAHRIAWILHHRRRPTRGHHIALTCSVPACCNPLHGQEQTPHATQDAYLRSERASHRRQAWRDQQPLTQHQLTAQFGISQPMVSQILAQISWPEE
jgi:hypothetical protein